MGMADLDEINEIEEKKQGWASKLGDLLGPSEAEAGTIGKAFKLIAKPEVGKGAISRTSKLLQGTEFMGKTIKNVTQGRGDTRYIILADDTVYPTNKSIVSDLVRTNETKKRTDVFGAYKSKDVAIQIDQALTSMDYHEARSNQYMNKATIRDNYKAYAKQMKEAGVEVMPFSLVQRGDRTYSMPTPYAKRLEKEGYLKVIEELK